MNKKIFLVLVMAIVMHVLSFSQTAEIKPSLKDSLKGLRIETKQDSLLPSIKLDGSVPIYNETGEKITGMDVIKAMQSGNGVPVRYINKNKEVKAYLLRQTTEEEKIKLKEKLKPFSENKNEIAGKPAKPFAVKDINGKIYALKNLKGKIVVLNFWFTECMPCIKEIPELNELVKKYKDKNVIFLAIANSEKSKIAKFLKKNNFKYTLIPKDEKNKIMEDYNINSYPTHIIIDAASNIKYYTEGLDDTTLSTLVKVIDALVK
jgi:thiol-disulfide isomerase/thioredoxin